MRNDAHCHFFSTTFFSALARQRGRGDSVPQLCSELQWDDPGTPAALADRWVRELDANDVARAALIASVPGDEASVASAIASHPKRFVGFFMTLFNATPEELREIHAGLVAGLENGTLNPVIGKEFPLADAVKAHVAIMESAAYGKIVLVP